MGGAELRVGCGSEVIPMPGQRLQWYEAKARVMAGGLLGLALLTVPATAGVLDRLEHLRTAAESNEVAQVDLIGLVLWANAAESRMVVIQDREIALLELDWGDVRVEPGAKVRLRGRVLVERRGDWLRLGPVGPVVDNDGVHALKAKSGTVYLEAGRQPFRLEWFNGTDAAALEVEWNGPGQAVAAVPRGGVVSAGDSGGGGGLGAGFGV